MSVWRVSVKRLFLGDSLAPPCCSVPVVSSQEGNHLISVGGFIVILKGGWHSGRFNHSSVSELNSNPSFAAFFFSLLNDFGPFPLASPSFLIFKLGRKKYSVLL